MCSMCINGLAVNYAARLAISFGTINNSVAGNGNFVRGGGGC